MDALAAPIAQQIALKALAALGLSADPFHEPFHDRVLERDAVRQLAHGVMVTPALQRLFCSHVSAKAR